MHEIFDASGSQIATGTGFSVSADGLVATNHHVVENGHVFSLVTSQGAKFDDAKVVASDPEKDLALLKIDSKDLPYLALAESSKAPLGKRVAIYGSPRGLAGSLSEGIISASERNLNKSFPGEKIPNNGNLIQTTAPISSGSSGSPLFDAEGKVLGVMTLSLQQNAQNLNFAIPVEALKSLIDRAKEGPSTLGGEYSAPKIDFDTAIEDEPAYRRLRQQMSVGNWVESLKITGFLVEKFPKSPLIHFQNGYCAGMLRLDNQAELSYTKVIELDPLNQLAWNNLGLALSSQKKLQDALIAFEKAVSINPNYPQAWENIVRTNAVLGNWPKATTALDTLAQIDLKIAREFARPLVGLRIPDAHFRQALERAMSHEVADTSSNSNVKFRVVGVSPDDPLAVRSGPGANFPRVISIANGEEVFVTGAGKMNGSTKWLPIDFGNSSGWVASKYLKSSE
ncbi:MAG: tetratricopeptide repeat protein [Alphaproteobacteria bacterium]|nr:MAG: tetratricopeptide repeat protein [Alphaproteobacteria bacterium]